MQFVDLEAQQKRILPNGLSLREYINQRLSEVFDHGRYILGPEVEELEHKLAAFVGVDNCVSISSGTDALLVALLALGIRPGDEVITTPFSFIATAETIALLGARPVYVDIDPRTYNLDPDQLDAAISTNTKAIIPVSLYGQPADFPCINQIASRHRIPVIEDGAQSFGATQLGKRSCSLSTIGITSFFPSKPLGSYGDGGACFTNDKDLAERMRRISRHGQSRRYFHTELGINGRLDTLHAAILLAKLELFDSEIEARMEIGNSYSRKLNSAGLMTTPFIKEGNTSVYAQYTIEVADRLSVQAALNRKNIPTAVHYPTLLCQQPALKACGPRCKTGCITPKAQKASKHVLSLPMHPYLSEVDQDKVVEAVISAIQ